MTTPEKPKVEVVYVTRLSQEVYEDFEKGLILHGVPASDLEAGYRNGVEAVLRKLRTKIVQS
jgi:hypothetical protein